MGKLGRIFKKMHIKNLKMYTVFGRKKYMKHLCKIYKNMEYNLKHNYQDLLHQMYILIQLQKYLLEKVQQLLQIACF